MNGPHLRGELLELLSVILLWFCPDLREFLERTRDDRFLRQLPTALSGNRDESFNSHDGLFRDPRPRPANTRTVARDIAQHRTCQLWIHLQAGDLGQEGV